MAYAVVRMDILLPLLSISSLFSCASQNSEIQSVSASGGATVSPTGGSSASTGGTASSTTLPTIDAPVECSMYDGEIITTTQTNSRFVVVGGALYVHFPIDQGGTVQTDVDEIRFNPYARQVVSSAPHYGNSLASSGGRIFWDERPHFVAYLGDDTSTYRISSYDPATKQVGLLATNGARTPIGGPTGVVVVDNAGGMDFYPTDGRPAKQLCSSVSVTTAAVNSTMALGVSVRNASLCDLATGSGSSWVPYAGYDGTAIRAVEMDEHYAYVLHSAVIGSTLDGVYRLNLASLEVTPILAGSYTQMRLFGSELWLADESGQIFRTTEASSFALTLVTSQTAILQLQVDTDYVYWHQAADSTIGCIKRLAKPQ